MCSLCINTPSHFSLLTTYFSESNLISSYSKATKIYFLGAPKPTQGDVWYLWLLLKRGGCTPRTFKEARTFFVPPTTPSKTPASLVGFLMVLPTKNLHYSLKKLLRITHHRVNCVASSSYSWWEVYQSLLLSTNITKAWSNHLGQNLTQAKSLGLWNPARSTSTSSRRRLQKHR